MKNEIKYAIYMIGIGMSLVLYAHTEFSTKREVETLKSIIERIDQRVYDIHSRGRQ